jgi:hypothetical protein
MPVTQALSSASYGVPPNQVLSKPVGTTSNANITTATRGGNKKKQYGGITVQGNTTQNTYQSNSATSPSQNSNQFQQTTAQANVNASNDNGAYVQRPQGLTANSSGGSRRKSRKSRKTRKTRKSRKTSKRIKHKRRNTYKK